MRNGNTLPFGPTQVLLHSGCHEGALFCGGPADAPDARLTQGEHDRGLGERVCRSAAAIYYCASYLRLVVLANIAVRSLEQVSVLVQLVAEEGLAKGLLDLPLTGMRGLPAIEADRAHDLVDIVHDPLDHHRRVAVPGLL